MLYNDIMENQHDVEQYAEQHTSPHMITMNLRKTLIFLNLKADSFCFALIVIQWMSIWIIYIILAEMGFFRAAWQVEWGWQTERKWN